MNTIKVLLVEDEAMLAMIIKETLEMNGFEIDIAGDGVEGWTKFKNRQPDICVVDVMMPRKDGYSLVEDIRKIDDLVPIIFLTAKSQTADVIKGLEIGADDYMKKPFGMEELMLRIKKLIRRCSVNQGETNTANLVDNTIGKFHFDFKKLEIVLGNITIDLSQREAELLHLLLINKNQVLERKTALLKLWGDDNIFAARSMDVYITRLRKYLALDPTVEILNIRGVGFKLID
ncbi:MULTISPECIES: response regulator transcription factor [unclassified Chryseobacterium]|uniref:response regulator transcription factor n=1 Tax=unclassified Chryseobacterium TaxID=2593645 RepID=UPI000E0A5518|nr:MULTISPECIES: response regulator transcription factor [unclassified Chryseobacterium]MDQ1856358.1 response regulator transcription factor [Chryseobacterium sp. WLY505]